MILVAVKTLKNAKQRLSPALTPEERRELAQAMLEDVLAALAACLHRDLVALVTGDPHAQRMAERHSFAVIDDPVDPGETGAIEAATRACVARGAEFTLVVPGDLPLITAAEVEKIFAAAPQEGTVLVPSASGRGTNAVFRRPADLFPLCFGNDSFLSHLTAAKATGKPVHVLKLAGVGLDVDEPSDLAALLAFQGATRTQQLLKRFYKRGCQGKTLLPGRTARCFLGVQPCLGRRRRVRDTVSTTLPVYGKMEDGWRSGGRLCWRATCPGIANRKLIERLCAGAGRGLPQRRSSPLSIDFPMPPKTRMTTLQTASGRARAGCRWFHDRRLWFGSDALQAGTGWHSANHGSI